ncbi:heterokaryon incompatibility, partial [Lasiosphaeris hirsuta]
MFLGKPHPTRRCPSYEAISYAWGNVKSEEKIICNGRLLRITSSLAAALRRTRLRDRPRVLWADGICINQKDDSDKEQQVPLMAAIYSQAKQVLCWLGEDDE